MSTDTYVAEFGELFPAVYLRFHRRDEKRSELSGASQAVLLHLSSAGPLTVGELSRHLGRAQSVTSEIVDQLESKSLLSRQQDPADRRRTLVWLTDEGLAVLDRSREVLSRALLARAFERMEKRELDSLIRGMRALVRAADRPSAEEKRR